MAISTDNSVARGSTTFNPLADGIHLVCSSPFTRLSARLHSLPLFSTKMPFPQKSEEEIQRGLSLLEPQFATLMEEKDVNTLVRAIMGLSGVKRHQTLAGLASTEELARSRLESCLGVVEADGFEAMIQISGLLETWRAARARSAAHEEAQAEAAASGRLRDVPHVENRGM